MTEVHVTTLADSGPGSLREALLTAGPRIVVIDVTGVIFTKTPLIIPTEFTSEAE